MTNTYKAAFSITKILLPIEFSPMSEATLEAATGLAQQFHAAIHLVHIIPETPDFNGSDFFPETAVLQEHRKTIEDKLEARKDELMHKGVSASFSIGEGNDVVGSLMSAIREENADMVVISTHGLSGWRPLILGSIAEQMIKQVNCTLLLLKSDQLVSGAEEPAIGTWKDAVVRHDAAIGRLGSRVPRPETLAQEQLSSSAEDRTGRTEQRYDRSHSLTK